MHLPYRAADCSRPIAQCLYAEQYPGFPYTSYKSLVWQFLYPIEQIFFSSFSKTEKWVFTQNIFQKILACTKKFYA